MKSNSYEVVEKTDLEHLMFEYLMTFKKSAVTPRTFEGIIRNFKLHIVPHIGKMKVYDIDNYTIQKLVNILLDQGYSVDTTKKCKHLLNQFFEYAIDNKWVLQNPTNRVQVRAKDKAQSKKEKYKALPPEVRVKFMEALNRDEANFIKPLCICLMFSGLRIGEALAITWGNIDFENKTLKVEQAITQEPKFDSNGKVKSRTTIIGTTKTTCSVREIPIADIVVQTLQDWREKQISREKNNKNVTGDLTSRNAFIFANDDGTFRTYSGTKQIFERFKRRNDLTKYHIGFHGLRHTFSNLLFEMNENPKVIQQLLGHRDVKTTLTVYNSVDKSYYKQATEKLNNLFSEEKMAEFKEFEKKKDIPAHNIKIDEDEEETDPEILMLEKILAEKKAKRKQQQEEM